MKVLVTGANGFVGSYLTARLGELGHQVIAASGPGGERNIWASHYVDLDLRERASIEAAVETDPDAVVHLAGQASVSASHRDPEGTWQVNALGTTMLALALEARSRHTWGETTLLVVSSAEVYGPGPARPRFETDPVNPVSPYAASKAGAEANVLEVAQRGILGVIVARPFPHTGPGQPARFVVPGFIERIRAAARAGAPVVTTGNLEPVRDILDVRDVVEAYVALLQRGTPGQVYNVASGTGVRLEDLFYRIAKQIGGHVEPVRDPSLARTVDIPHLVGSAEKLRAATGWAPRYTLDQTLQSMIDAEAH